LCAYAGDKKELYKIWDDDLKQKIRKRNILEAIGLIAVFAAVAVAVNLPEYRQYLSLLIGVGVFCLYRAILEFIDESHVNYLMHEWELRGRIAEFDRDTRDRDYFRALNSGEGFEEDQTAG
jgi:hypothetical protein